MRASAQAGQHASSLSCQKVAVHAELKIEFPSHAMSPFMRAEKDKRIQYSHSHDTEYPPLRPDRLAILDRVTVGLAKVPRLEVGLQQGFPIVDVAKSPLTLLVPPASPETL